MIPLSENDIELIENYRSGYLSPAEQSAFEQRLKNDPDFHRNALHWQYVIDALQPNEEDLAYQAQVRAFLHKRRRIERWKHWGKWILILLTFGCVLYYMFSKKPTEKAIHEQVMAELQRPYTSHQSTLGTEAGNVSALELFDDRQYATAIPSLQEEFDASGNKDTILLFYKGISLLQTSETEEAIKLLRLSVTSQQTMQDDARWFLALALLREKKYDEAEKELEKLSDSSVWEKESKQFLSLLK